MGAQIVGEAGVDKRIDALATALVVGLRVQDLENKGPVVMAGFVAANTLRGEVQTITTEELSQKLANGEPIQLLDVRTPGEYEAWHLPNARLVPIDELRDHLQELDPEKETVVYCKVGLRGYLASRILLQHGFRTLYNLTGGLVAYPKET